jgi:hypothetical protein
VLSYMCDSSIWGYPRVRAAVGWTGDLLIAGLPRCGVYSASQEMAEPVEWVSLANSLSLYARRDGVMKVAYGLNRR